LPFCALSHPGVYKRIHAAPIFETEKEYAEYVFNAVTTPPNNVFAGDCVSRASETNIIMCTNLWKPIHA